MGDRITGGIGEADNAAVGRGNVQASVTMPSDPGMAIFQLVIEVHGLNDKVQTVIRRTEQWWFALVFVFVFFGLLSMVGAGFLFSTSQQVRELQQQVSALQYQVQTLRQQMIP